MIKIRQILRMHTQGYSKLQIASQTGIARNTLKKYIKAFSDCQLSWEEVNNLSDKHLEDFFVKPEEKPSSAGMHTVQIPYKLIKYDRVYLIRVRLQETGEQGQYRC